MKKGFIYIFLLIVVFLNIGYIFLKKRHQKNESLIYKKTYSTERKISKNIFIQDRYLFQENWKDTISISQIVNKHPILILRIPRVSCQQCKATELDNLKRNFLNEDLGNVCTILTVNTTRDIKSLRLSFNFKFTMAGGTEQDILKINAEKYHKPYYFILDTNLMASMFYFPEILTPELTKSYFKKVKAKYFTNIH